MVYDNKTKRWLHNIYKKTNGNPNEFLGQREDLTPEKLVKLQKI